MWWGCLATCRPWGLSPVFPPRLVHTCDGRSSGLPTIPVGASPLTWGLARRMPGAWGVVRQHAPLPEDRLLPFCGLLVPPADSRFSGTLNLCCEDEKSSESGGEGAVGPKECFNCTHWFFENETHKHVHMLGDSENEK